MKLEPFAMERMQSTYENQVEFNLSESGVHPLQLGELVDAAPDRAALLAEALRYTQSNGTVPLRDAIGALYPGATRDHVQVTNGGSEANYITAWSLVEPGDEVVMMTPNYMQTWGLALAFGATVRPWPLVVGHGRWSMDADALERMATPRTKLIIICNPNNPTGARFDAAELDRVAAVAARHGSWILADEIYRGAERDGRETPTIWGRYDRPARAAHRLGRRVAGARRDALVVSRLHDDRARRPERRAGAPRARARAARTDSRADARHHRKELSNRRGVARRARWIVHVHPT
jgi:aspartate/methionine/tyrosine aminotransferase